MLLEGIDWRAPERTWPPLAAGYSAHHTINDCPARRLYRFSGDRKGQHARDHRARYRGWMHADGYAGFEDLYRTGSIHGVACMAGRHHRPYPGRQDHLG
jgi:hypothetical protein